MHVAVYGVGRSGTKAIQLYLAYVLAREHGEVWINYEPYAWLDRKAVQRNAEGFYHHSTSPQLLSDATRLSPGHRRFLRGLTHSDRPIVTKFVRANGRLDAVSQMLEPDWSVVIVRDLYQVLESLARVGWAFLPGGHGRRWDDFVREVRAAGLVERLGWCLERIRRPPDQNALYWYVMNLAALERASTPATVLDYAAIGEIEGLARAVFHPSHDVPPFHSASFDGDNIHRDHPLASPPRRRSAAQLANRLLARVHATERLGLFVPGARAGGPARVSEQPSAPRVPAREREPARERSDLREFLNEDIRTRLARRRAWPG